MQTGINVVSSAIEIIAGPGKGEVERAAKIIGVSPPTLYRWVRAGHMRGARGADLLRVYELTGLSLELLLGADGAWKQALVESSRRKGMADIKGADVFSKNSFGFGSKIRWRRAHCREA